MIQGTAESRQWVRGMFGQIAPRYDLLNHLLSFNLDKHWRNHTVRRVTPALLQSNARVLDLCCGTGDLLLALEKRRGAPILGSDFCHPMLIGANQKIGKSKSRSLLFEADALDLPIASESLDLITVAFGFRNLVDYRQGLSELVRVLRPGGAAAILEFSQPTNRVFAAAYGYFSNSVLPKVGGWISGAPDAYSYLPASIKRFPGAVELASQMRGAGFEEVTFDRLTFGTVALHIGRKASAPARLSAA